MLQVFAIPVSVLAAGPPHFPDPPPHPGPAFNLDAPQRQDLTPTQTEQHVLSSSILQVFLCLELVSL